MKSAVFEELQAIRKKHHGVLRGKDVIAFARSPKTACHSEFDWDDKKCGDEHRLWQARELIAVFVTVIKPNTPPVRTFVSLRADRALPGGGYRASIDVMTHASMRKQFLAEALDDAERWQAKYALLTELTPVFKEISRLRAKHGKHAA